MQVGINPEVSTMSENNAIVNETVEQTENKPVENKESNSGEFKFFKCCSASLKRFSVLIFVINVFLSIALTGVGVVLCAVYIGVEMLALLALPIATVFVILIVIARFISALIYGYAEIVEKSEK